MAKQSGIIKLKGNLDGLSFYTLNGEYIVRKPVGFTRYAIKTAREWIGFKNHAKGLTSSNLRFRTFTLY